MIVQETYREKKSLSFLWWGMAFLLGILSIFAMAQGFTGTFGNRNYFAGFLIQLFPLFLALGVLALKEKRPFGIPLWVYVLGATSSLVTLVLIKSRAGLGAALVAGLLVLFISFYLRKSPPVRKQLLWGLAGGLLPWVLFLPFYFLGDYRFSENHLNLLTYEAWFNRVDSFRAAWDSIKASPLVGWGTGKLL